MMVAAIAESQSDARCYLADLLTRSARVIVGDEERQVRVVGEEYDLFKGGNERVVNSWEDTVNTEDPVCEVTFWDAEHGLTDGKSVRLEVPRRNPPGLLHILKGTVMRVRDHQVTVKGRNYIGVEK